MAAFMPRFMSGSCPTFASSPGFWSPSSAGAGAAALAASAALSAAGADAGCVAVRSSAGVPVTLSQASPAPDHLAIHSAGEAVSPAAPTQSAGWAPAVPADAAIAANAIPATHTWRTRLLLMRPSPPVQPASSRDAWQRASYPDGASASRPRRRWRVAARGWQRDPAAYPRPRDAAYRPLVRRAP